MPFIGSNADRRFRLFAWRGVALVAIIALQMLLLACNDLEQPKSEPYYSGTTPPRKQEFRWSNGKLPKTLDPARATAPPETDLIRAVYEGLTELDPQTLEEEPAAAERWTSSDDLRTWTFYLRADAKWSNGKPLTSEDFVRSWTRLAEMGDTVAHPDLLKNVVGMPLKKKESLPTARPSEQQATSNIETNSNSNAPERIETANSNANSQAVPAVSQFGVTAPDPRILKVQLVTPDRDFPKLVAHPMFRPIFDPAPFVDEKQITPNVVTNGVFKISVTDQTGVTLEPSATYWNRSSIRLERVRLVAVENAEQALAAYKAGDLDAVTNAEFEPLALKLLEPYEDFRRRTHAAINFYEINHEKSPFDDRRIREALAISIERERLTEGEMEGLTQPALSFLPFAADSDVKIVQDKERARDLLEEAGYPAGKDFPPIRLVINRNDTQQRIARAVARMWKQNLNIDTEVVVKENAEVEEARKTGDFDLIRRNMVFPTADELMSILSILKPPEHSTEATPPRSPEVGVEARDPRASSAADANERPAPVESPDVTMSEANALYELWAVPLYFPTSYSLVKPYVTGFETNSLDAPSLAEVSINSDWQPK